MVNKRRQYMWSPLPPGVHIAIVFGSISLIFLIGGWIYRDGLIELAAGAFGAFAIVEVGRASYTAGLRSEAWSREKLRRSSYFGKEENTNHDSGESNYHDDGG